MRVVIEKLALVLVGTAVVWCIIYGIIWYIDRDFEEEKQFILQNPVRSMGGVIGETSYKGKGFTIEYIVDDRKLRFKTSVTNEFFDNTFIGDSVQIVYSKIDPEKVILQYSLDHPRKR